MSRIVTLLVLVAVTFGWLYLSWVNMRLALGLGMTAFGFMGLGALAVLWITFGGDVWVGEDDSNSYLDVKYVQNRTFLRNKGEDTDG